MERMSESELSFWLDNFMDSLGYSEEDVKQRIMYNNRCSYARNVSNKILMNKDYIDKILVGSQREGVSLGYTTDLDIMQINNSVLCLSDLESPHNSDNVFQVVRQDVPPGYCKLKLYSVGNQQRFEDVSYALTNQSYLSSLKYVERNEDFNNNSTTLIGKRTEYQQRHGPSIPKFVEFPTIVKLILAYSGINLKPQNMDFVKVLPCECPDIMQRWRTRERRFDWPSPSTISHVASLSGHVVPVGSKNPVESDLQWRICYTLAEIKLVQSFNNTQTKVYVILKYIAKHVLCKNTLVTSYIMKNIMFWMCEYTPSCQFQPETILLHVRHALEDLRKSLHRGRLRNYMIPERNLYPGTMNVSEKYSLTNGISLLVKRGPCSLRGYIELLENDKLPKTSSDDLQTFVVCHLIEKQSQLLLQCMNNPELIRMFIDMSSCNNILSKWKMTITHVVILLHKYGPPIISTPLDIPLEPVESHPEHLNLPDTITMLDVNVTQKDISILSVAQIYSLLAYCLFLLLFILMKLFKYYVGGLDNSYSTNAYQKSA